MANDFYLNEILEDSASGAEDWSLLEQEFHEWQVFSDFTDIVGYMGLPAVLSIILDLMKQKGIK